MEHHLTHFLYLKTRNNYSHYLKNTRPLETHSKPKVTHSTNMFFFFFFSSSHMRYIGDPATYTHPNPPTLIQRSLLRSLPQPRCRTRQRPTRPAPLSCFILIIMLPDPPTPSNISPGNLAVVSRYLVSSVLIIETNALIPR